jgi:hypothetical protein
MTSQDYSAIHGRQQSMNGVNPAAFQGNGDNSGMNTANSGGGGGGRKPTADSHAYTLYKPNQGKANGARAAKFSNGGGSIDGT